jgi:hypothetical protein
MTPLTLPFRLTGKYLLSVKSLLAGLHIAPEHPDLHRLAIQLHQEIAKSTSENATVRAVVEEGIKKVFPQFPATDLKKWNEEWGKKNQGIAAAVAGELSLRWSRSIEFILTRPELASRPIFYSS